MQETVKTYEIMIEEFKSELLHQISQQESVILTHV